MRAILMAALVLSITLAGCSGKGHGLDPYLVKSGEAPDACYYADMEGEEWEMASTYLGIDSNPGSVSQKVIADAADANDLQAVPVDNRIAVYECKFTDSDASFISAAVKFASKEDADYWLQQDESMEFFSGGCSQQAKAFRTDTVVGSIASLDAGWHPAVAEARDKALERIIGDGAESLC